jgi:hypothetical protein
MLGTELVQVEVEVEVTTDGQSASLSWCRAPIWNLWPEFSFLSDNCVFLDVKHPLWREGESVINSYNCFWDLPEQSLSGPSLAELTTQVPCLLSDSPQPGGPGSRIYIPLEQGGPVVCPDTWLLFVASYVSQGYGRGIITRLHTGYLYTEIRHTYV